MIRPQDIDDDGLPIPMKVNQNKPTNVSWDDEGLPVPAKKKDSVDIGASASFGGVKDSGGILGGLLRNTKKIVTDEKPQPEYEPEIKIDENDPIASLGKHILSKTERFNGGSGDIAGQKLSAQNKMIRKPTTDKMLPTYAGEVMDIAKQSIFPTTQDAAKYLQDHAGKNGGSIMANNQTAKVAIDQINDANEVTQSINDNGGDLTKAAIQYWSNKDDEIGKRIKTMNGDIPPAMVGHLIDGFLQQKGTKEWANTSQENHNHYKEQEDNFYLNFPDIRNEKILSLIGQWREDNHKNNPFHNLPGTKAADEAMDELVKEGKLSIFDKDFYTKYTRPGIYTGAYKIKTGGFVESLVRSAKEGIEDLPKGVYELTGLNSLIGNRANEEYDKAQQEYTEPHVKFKGINELSNIMGNLAGVVVPIGGEGKILKGLGIVNDAEKANRLAMMGTFYHGLYQDNLKYMDSGEARVAALMQSIVYGYISKTLPKVARDVVKESSPTIKELVLKLKSGEISMAAAAQEIGETALGKAQALAKTVGKGAETNVKMAGEMGLATAINDHIKGAFSGKFDGDKTTENVVHTVKTMLIGGAPLSLLGARGHKEFNADLLNEIAERPAEARAHIEELSKTDPEFAKQAPEILKNLDHLEQVHETVKNSGWSDSQKKKIQLLSLNEKILSDKIKTLPDKDLGREESKQLEEIKLEKEKVLNPDISNTDLIEKHYKADLIPKGFKGALENDKGKFDENKVGEFLKKIAQSDEEKLSEVPEQLIEIAKERWPDAGKAEETTPVVETKITETEKPTITKEGIEQERTVEVEKAHKPEIKFSLISPEELVNSKDPIKFKEEHRAIKDKLKKLRQLADCIWP